MKNLIKKILREQEEVKGVSRFVFNDETKKHDETINTVQAPVFFRAVRFLVDGNSESELDSLAHSDSWDRWLVLGEFLKLLGITDNEVDTTSAAGLPSKMIWAAVDNYKGIKDGSIESMGQLELRPLKEYRVEMMENTTEHVTYYWQPTISGYDENDVSAEIYEDEDGLYDWWEWDNQPGYDRDVGDSDSDGKEILDMQVTSNKPQTGNFPLTGGKEINEVESPEENDLIDKLRKIMKQWKKEDKENEWYSKIENALKELHISLQE